MKIRHVAILAFAAVLAGTAQAQLPLPFPGQPGPDYSNRPQCTPGYVRSVEQQAAAMEKLRTAGPEAMSRLCTLIELGSAWLDDERSEGTRRQLRELLGFDVDLARAAVQCRIGQGNLERDLMTRLGYLRSELVRCNDTI